MYRTLEYLPGISDSDVARLRSAGIRHTNQLLHRTTLDTDRKRLSKKTGISTSRLLEFAHQCTLLEVSGTLYRPEAVIQIGPTDAARFGGEGVLAHGGLLARF